MATPESDQDVSGKSLVGVGVVAAIKLPLGFLFLGLLVGDMAGLTSESLVSKLIALLFALFGGSIVLLFKRFSPQERGEIGLLLISISLGMIIGVHAGILTSQYRLLSPKPISQIVKLSEGAPSASGSVVQPNAVKVSDPQSNVPASPRVVKQPPQTSSAETAKCPDESRYLKGKYTPGISNIDSRYVAHVISGDEAYLELKSLIQGRK